MPRDGCAGCRAGGVDEGMAGPSTTTAPCKACAGSVLASTAGDDGSSRAFPVDLPRTWPAPNGLPSPRVPGGRRAWRDPLDEAGFPWMYRVVCLHAQTRTVLDGGPPAGSGHPLEGRSGDRPPPEAVEVLSEISAFLRVKLPTEAVESWTGCAAFVGRYAPFVYAEVERRATALLEGRRAHEGAGGGGGGSRALRTGLPIPPVSITLQMAQDVADVTNVELPSEARTSEEAWTRFFDRNAFEYVRLLHHPEEMQRSRGRPLVHPLASRRAFSVTDDLLANDPNDKARSTLPAAVEGVVGNVLQEETTRWIKKDIAARERSLALWGPSKGAACATCTGVLWHSSSRALKGLPPVCMGLVGADAEGNDQASPAMTSERMPPPGQEWHYLCVGRASGIVLPTVAHAYESHGGDVLGRLALPRAVAGVLYYAKGTYSPDVALGFSVEQKFRKVGGSTCPSYGIDFSSSVADRGRALTYLAQVLKERKEVLKKQASPQATPSRAEHAKERPRTRVEPGDAHEDARHHGAPFSGNPGRPHAAGDDSPVVERVRARLKTMRKALASSSDTSLFQRDADGRTAPERFARRYWANVQSTCAWWLKEDASGTTGAGRFAAQYAKNVERTANFLAAGDDKSVRERERFWSRYKSNAERTYAFASERVAKTVSALDLDDALARLDSLLSHWTGRPPPPPAPPSA